MSKVEYKIEHRDLVNRTMAGLKDLRHEVSKITTEEDETYRTQVSKAGVILSTLAVQAPKPPLPQQNAKEVDRFLDQVLTQGSLFGSYSMENLADRLKGLAAQARKLKAKRDSNLANTLGAVSEDLTVGGVIQVVVESIHWLAQDPNGVLCHAAQICPPEPLEGTVRSDTPEGHQVILKAAEEPVGPDSFGGDEYTSDPLDGRLSSYGG